MSIKWFFALNDAGNDYANYCLMTQVAVRSAQRHTRLEPVFLYDGAPCALTDWMQAHRVRVIHHRTSMYDRLVEHAQASGRKQSVSTGAGAYLRLDIPLLCEQLGIADTYALYTDCDVLFRADPEPVLRGLAPEFFAAAPQFDRDNPADMNSGVLWMNLPRLRQMYAPFCAYIREHMDTLRQTGYDQAALRAFYGTRRHGGPAWDALPPELNWKPHWGANEEAVIVHFHGPKPTTRTRLSRAAAPPIYVDLATSEYYRSCVEWDAYAAGLESPPPATAARAAVLDPLPLALQAFDEAAYLHAHPDVARAVSARQYTSGLEHFRTAGIWEGRRAPEPCHQALQDRSPGAQAAPCAPPAWERAASRCWASLCVDARWPVEDGGDLLVVGAADFAARLAAYAERPVRQCSAREFAAMKVAAAATVRVLVAQLDEDDTAASAVCALLRQARERLRPGALVVAWVALPRPGQLPSPRLRRLIEPLATVLQLQRQVGGDRHDLLVLRIANPRPD